MRNHELACSFIGSNGGERRIYLRKGRDMADVLQEFANSCAALGDNRATSPSNSQHKLLDRKSKVSVR